MRENVFVILSQFQSLVSNRSFRNNLFFNDRVVVSNHSLATVEQRLICLLEMWERHQEVKNQPIAISVA